MDVFFGWGLELDSGEWPSVAINANQEMVMAYIPSAYIPSDHQLAYRQGTLQHATVAWTIEETYGEGCEPSIAISRTTAMEVHRGADDDDDRLFYGLGSLTDGRILWLASDKYDKGLTPSVAINDGGFVFEVHRSENTGRLWYNVGLIDDASIHWKKKDDFADGDNPSVSMNNAGQAIVAYDRDNVVYYRLATTNGNDIEFQAEHGVADSASQPSVAVTDDGVFILCFTQSDSLWQRIGTIDGTTVSWGDAVTFDEGAQVSVAAQNGLAVQVHSWPQAGNMLYFSTSIITDRSRWMSDRVSELGNLPLRDLVLPGSHSGGMYLTQTSDSSKTQDMSVYGQLIYGLRWFDLRVTFIYTKLVHDLVIYQDEPSPEFGPKLTDVLDDIRKFMERGGRELIILKFSHFESIGTDEWNLMVKEIDDRVGSWLYRGPLPAGKRLADLTLNEYGGAVLLVVDGDWAMNDPRPGYWVYRDATAENPAEGDLRVYDEYSRTNDYNEMSTDQINKFFSYNGTCTDAVYSACDLFLLSWTLTTTSVESIESLALTPNQHLADEVGKLPVKNDWGKIINIVCVDYVEYARPSDVAIASKNDGGAHG